MAMAPAASVSATPFAARPAATAVRPRCVAAAAATAVGSGRGAEGSGKWWAPLVGWSGRAEYLEAHRRVAREDRDDGAAAARRGRQFVGGLTEEKARELRARMVDTECFHDAMYHSAIASRLARSA